MSPLHSVIVAEPMKRITFGFFAVCLCFTSGCGSNSDVTEDGVARDHLDANVAAAGKLPEIYTSGLDAAVTRSIDQAMDAVRKEPRSDKRWGYLGMLVLAHDLYEPAAKCFSEATRLNQSEPLWPYYESIALRSLDLKTAIDRSRRAVELFGTGVVPPRIRLAKMLIEDEQLGEAEAVLSDVIKDEPENAVARVALAKIYLLKNQPQQALESIDLAQINLANANHVVAGCRSPPSSWSVRRGEEAG